MSLKTETHRFEAHDNLLISVMREQAGTLAKAILEGVMNGIDAGATRVEITASPEQVSIHDNGKGFRTREEILRNFKVFGQPQDEQERLEKTYGYFRMGRGQIFTFGANRWQTGHFEMGIDLDTRGLDFELSETKDLVDGCHINIDLYERHHMLPSDFAALEREVTLYVKFSPISILFNGKQVSKNPADETWDVETDDAYIRLRQSGSLDIYNQGMFVESKHGFEFGTGGVVVSKERLKVNFARNQLMPGQCPVWKRLRTYLRSTTTQRVNNAARRLTPEERDFLAQQIAHGEIRDRTLRKKKLITDVQGIDWTVERVENYCSQHGIHALVVSPINDIKGEILHQERRAFVLAPTTLERFGCETATDLLDLMSERHLWYYLPSRAKVIAFGDAVQSVKANYRIVPETQWKPRERIALEFLKGMQNWALVRHMESGMQPRTLLLGEADSALGWTDGQSYIALHRSLFRDLSSVSSWSQLVDVLIHEYCHDGDSAGTHNHSGDFYRLFHDIRMHRGGAFLEECLRSYPARLQQDGRKASRQMLRMQDKLMILEREERLLNDRQQEVAEMAGKLEAAGEKAKKEKAKKEKPKKEKKAQPRKKAAKTQGTARKKVERAAA